MQTVKNLSFTVTDAMHPMSIRPTVKIVNLNKRMAITNQNATFTALAVVQPMCTFRIVQTAKPNCQKTHRQPRQRPQARPWRTEWHIGNQHGHATNAIRCSGHTNSR